MCLKSVKKNILIKKKRPVRFKQKKIDAQKRRSSTMHYIILEYQN